MHQTLRSKFLQMEADLDKLVRDLAEISDEKLSAKPPGGGWSVLEIIQHVMIVEKASLAYVKKKSSCPDRFKKADWTNGLRIGVLRFFLFAPLKVKAPKVVNETNFDPQAEYDGLVEEWRNNRVEMMAFLDGLPDEYLDKLLYKHFVTGRVTIDGMLVLMRDHLRRHRRQIRKTLEAVQ